MVPLYAYCTIVEHPQLDQIERGKKTQHSDWGMNSQSLENAIPNPLFKSGNAFSKNALS